MNYSVGDLLDLLNNNPSLALRNKKLLSELNNLKDQATGTLLKKGTKGGWREDLGRYFRSSWEANIARYLNFIGEKWEYETKEWEFPLKRGNRFYKCDFYLPRLDEYWEVKGYMDQGSQVKLNRMKKYYPQVNIRIIGQDEYREIAKVKSMIPQWEG